MLDSLERSKQTTLPRFLYALGISHVGQYLAELLANELGGVEKLMTMSQDELLRIPGVGPEVAASIVRFFGTLENRVLVSRLLEHGVRWKDEPQAVSDRLRGKRFVFTGTLQNMTRDRAFNAVKELGGQVSSSVSASVDYLVVGENPGSKLAKAEALGVLVMSEQAFLDLIRSS